MKPDIGTLYRIIGELHVQCLFLQNQLNEQNNSAINDLQEKIMKKSEQIQDLIRENEELKRGLKTKAVDNT